MTTRTILARESAGLLWLDLVEPTEAELRQVAAEYGLHPMTVKDCLDPEHLPKYERLGPWTFLIVRAYDEREGARGETVQQMTRKLAVFVGADALITVHRQDQPYLTALQAQYEACGRLAASPAEAQQQALPRLVADVLNGVVDSYLKPLEALEGQLDELEATMFGQREFAMHLQRAYQVKRRISVAKRLLWRTYDVVQRLTPSTEAGAPLYRDARENVDSLRFYADELLEEVDSLLHIQLAVAAHRTNQAMRILTIFSAFFLPLSFIAGIYGMNFDFMPELRQRWGYAAVLLLMALVALGIFLWIRRRGWLRP